MKKILVCFLCILLLIGSFIIKVNASVQHVDMMDDAYIKNVSKEYENKIYEQKLKEQQKKANQKKTLSKKKKTQNTVADKQQSVQAVSAGNYSQSDIELLYKICHAESRGESERGQMAVANVILNRVKSSKFPNSIRAVIYQSGQFTPTKSKGFTNIVPSSGVKQSVNKVIAGQRVLSDNVLYFRSGKNSTKWGKLSLVARIGNQLFYAG